jgi:hypothetical protein
MISSCNGRQIKAAARSLLSNGLLVNDASLERPSGRKRTARP